MSARATKPAPIWFHGPPGALAALVPAGSELPAEACLELPKLDCVSAAHCADAGAGLWWVHASLPSRIPAGTHAGRLLFDGEAAFEAAIVVYPFHQVTLTPTQLVVQVAPGERTERHFVVINQGNSPLVLARDNAIGLMREDGLEDALSSAYRAAAEGLDRVAMAADALAARHALAAVRIEGGPITVEPDSHARFTATFRWPRKLEPGSTYEGTWTLATQTLSVTVTALEGQSDTDDDDVGDAKNVRVKAVKRKRS